MGICNACSHADGPGHTCYTPRDWDRFTTVDAERGPRLGGPHGGLTPGMPSPSPMDLVDPVFEAIWQTTKTWDVNAPEYYIGYCGMNGSHVMLILNAIRALQTQKWWDDLRYVQRQTEDVKTRSAHVNAELRKLLAAAPAK